MKAKLPSEEEIEAAHMFGGKTWPTLLDVESGPTSAIVNGKLQFPQVSLSDLK